MENFRKLFESPSFQVKMDTLAGDIEGTTTKMKKDSSGNEVFEIWVTNKKDIKRVTKEATKLFHLLKKVYEIEYDGERIAIYNKD